MSRLGLDLIVNAIGRGWTSLIALALVPLYLHYLGIQAFGLIGFFASLQAVSLLLDLGLSTTINREMARRSVTADDWSQRRDLLRTLEVVNWAIAVLLAVGIWLLAPVIADHWINPGTLARPTVIQSVQMMGLALALKWPVNLYNGALMGLQRQISMNVILVLIATITGGGALATLAFVAPTPEAFFAWQFLASGAATLVTAVWAWHCTHGPAMVAPRFRAGILIDTWRFAAGVSGVTVLGIILAQMDKLVLSAVLSLEDFGYYSLATMMATGLAILASPVFTAVFPALSTLVARKDSVALIKTYHRAAQTLAALVLPPMIMIAWFSREVLQAWTGSGAIASATAPVLSLLMLGSGFNALMTVPWALQLAHGYLRLGMFFNLVGVVFLLPMVLFGALHFGVTGAAAGWLILNVGYVAVGIPLIHRKLMRGNTWRWYGHDHLVPLRNAVTVTVLADLTIRLGGMPPIISIGMGMVLCYVWGRGSIAVVFAKQEGVSR
jgi:O-antigen/teichoic acid export membrane protein